jgi:thymidylate synthase
MLNKLLVFLICFTFTTAVLSEEIQRAEIVYKGTSGFFFSDEVGTKILKDLEAFKSYEVQLKLKDSKLSLLEEKISNLELSLKLTEDISDKYKSNYELEHKLRIADQKHYEKIIRKKSSFWNSKGLWFGIGFLTAGLMAVGLSFSLQEARE